MGNFTGAQARKADRLICALLVSDSIEDACKLSRIPRSTASRTMANPEFKKNYLAARRTALDAACTGLNAAVAESLTALRAIVTGGLSEAARVSAARSLLEFAERSLTLGEIENRLCAVEGRI